MTQPPVTHPGELLPWFVNGTLEGESLRHVEEHLRACLQCRREVDALRQLRHEVKATSDVRPPPVSELERLLADVKVERPPPHHRWFRPWLPLLTAAVLALAVGIGVWAPHGPQGPPVVDRAGAESEVLLPLVGDGEALPRQAFVLRWRAAPAWQEARFSVTVTAEDLTPIAEIRGLEAMAYKVPTEALVTQPPGARLFWRLEAVRPDGTRRTKISAVRLQ